jgi:hypothetical protein
MPFNSVLQHLLIELVNDFGLKDEFRNFGLNMLPQQLNGIVWCCSNVHRKASIQIILKTSLYASLGK